MQQLAWGRFNGGGEHMVLKQIPGESLPFSGALQLSLLLMEGSSSSYVLARKPKKHLITKPVTEEEAKS